MSRRSIACGGVGKWNTVVEQGEEWVVPGSKGVTSSCFLQRISLFLLSLFLSVSYLYHFSTTMRKGCDKLGRSHSLVGNARICPSAATVFFILIFVVWFIIYFLFVFKLFSLYKERKCGVPVWAEHQQVGGAGMRWSLWEDIQGGWIIQPADQNLCFEGCEAAQQFPKARTWRGSVQHASSAQQLLPVSQRSHFRVAQLLWVVCMVSTSVRATAEVNGAPGVVWLLYSFWAAFLQSQSLLRRKKKVIQWGLHTVSSAQLLVVHVWREKTLMRNSGSVSCGVKVPGNKALLAPGGSTHCSEVL